MYDKHYSFLLTRTPAATPQPSNQHFIDIWRVPAHEALSLQLAQITSCSRGRKCMRSAAAESLDPLQQRRVETRADELAQGNLRLFPQR